MRELLAELNRASEEGRECVWCSVVETRGSTPQKAGAVMLVYPDGSQAGTLGGGCIEAEVKQRALAVLVGQEEGKAEVLTFCLDDDYGWDDGLICGGRMTILVDPLGKRPLPPNPPPHISSPFVSVGGEGGAGNSYSPSPPTDTKGFEARGGGRGEGFRDSYHTRFAELVTAGRGCIEAVVFAHAPESLLGSRFLFAPDGRLVARRGGTEEPPATLVENLPELSTRPGPTVIHGVAYLPVLPRISLLVVGGGHVGQAVGRLAAEADFDIDVLDDRPAYVSAERFPSARRRLVGDIERTLADLAGGLGPDWYCLIITRGHRHDEEALFHLAPTRAGYVGMIGSKRKIKLIFEDLLARGLSPEVLERVHAPLGFDIGSQTVPEIAISIVAELIACRNLGSTQLRPRQRVRVSGMMEARL